jgi:hypothetical protein
MSYEYHEHGCSGNHVNSSCRSVMAQTIEGEVVTTTPTRGTIRDDIVALRQSEAAALARREEEPVQVWYWIDGMQLIDEETARTHPEWRTEHYYTMWPNGRVYSVRFGIDLPMDDVRAAIRLFDLPQLRLPQWAKRQFGIEQ